jgi:replicative DNA helicase
MAPSGIGKTATLIAFAANFARQERDIVFISLEQSESEIYKRLYANLLDIPVKDISLIDKEVIRRKVKEIKPTIGNIIAKQYAAKRITPLDISAFLDKLKNEKNIHNPVLIVDYLGLLKSDFMKNMDNSYAYIGSIAEELRAVAIEKNIIIFSPMQLNRQAYGNLEAGNETMSESLKVLHTLDSAFLVLQTPEMKDNGTVKIMFTKNRFSGITKGFEIKFDYDYFRFDDKFFIDGENITEMKTSSSELDSFNDELSKLMM